MDYDEAKAAVMSAVSPSDLFDADDQLAQKRYRELAATLHPDRSMGAPDAADLFAKLSSLWATRKNATSDSPVVVNTKRHAYLMDRTPLYRGDLANHYHARYNVDGEEKEAILKMPRNPRNSDLMQAEGMMLRKLWMEGEPRWRPYIPEHLESFRQRDKSDGKERLTNALIFPPGLFSLAEVHSAYPQGVEPKDVAWMWRRILVALGYVHSVGLVHGAIVPEHVLIHPEHHGMVLIDWCYAVEVDTPIKVVVTGPQKYFYPQEVLDKKPAKFSTDIYMATKCMMYILGDKSIRQFNAFAQGSMPKLESNRPQEAWALKEEFDELLENLWGERKFHPFSMPARA